MLELTELSAAVLANDKNAVLEVLSAGVEINKQDERGNSCLHYAAFVGDEEIISVLIEKGSRIDAKDTQGITPLHRAAVKDRHKCIELLLNAGASQWVACSKNWQTALHTCATNNSLDSARVLLEFNRDGVDKTDSRGCTALHIASYYGCAPMVDLLLKFGATISLRDKLGRTAFHWAALGGDDRAMGVLKAKGANPLSSDNRGSNALHMGAAVGSCQVIKWMLEQTDLDIQCVDEIGFTPLHHAVENGNVRAVRMLLENGASPYVPCTSGSRTTPLHIAAFYTEDSKTLEVLLEKESDLATALSLRLTDGSTLLHKACERGRVTRVDMLIKLGADVNASTLTGSTPLHCAASTGHQFSVKRLLKAGANIDSRVNGGFSALHLACSKGFLEAIRTLLDAGANPSARDDLNRSPAHFLAACNLPEKNPHLGVCLDPLIDAGFDISARDDEGMSVLHIAALHAKGELVEHLIQLGASPLWLDSCGRTPLHLAVNHAHNSKGIYALVRSDDRCVGRSDNQGFQPIHYAAHRGNHGLVAFLIDTMSALSLPTSGSPLHVTPLHIAAAKDYPMVVKGMITELKEKSQSVDAPYHYRELNLHESIGYETDNHGRIALHYAMYYGHLACCQLLLTLTHAPRRALSWEDRNGHTPLHLAAAQGHAHILGWVVSSYEVALTKTDRQQRTCMQLAALSTHESSTIELEGLLDRCRLDDVDANGRGMLHRACASSNTELVSRLLALGCKPYLSDCNGVTPMHVACRVGCRDVVRLLIEKGVSVEVADHKGIMPADCAAAEGNLGVLEDLLSTVCDTSLSSGDSALGSAEGRATPDIVILEPKVVSPITTPTSKNTMDLMTFSPDSTESATVAENLPSGDGDSDAKIKQEFISASPISNPADNGGVDNIISTQSALQSAYFGKIDCLKKILQVSPSLLSCTDLAGRTPLHLAARSGQTDCVQTLLDLGANVDEEDTFSETPIMVAIEHTDDTETIELLVDRGADITRQDEDGNTVFHLAALLNNGNAGGVFVAQLSQMSGEVKDNLANAKNNDGQTAVHIITKHGLFNYLIEFLPHAGASMFIRDHLERFPITCVVDDPDVTECLNFITECMLELMPSEDQRRSLSSTVSQKSRESKRRSTLSTVADETF